MEWTTMIVIVAGIIGGITLLMNYFPPNERLGKIHELEKELATKEAVAYLEVAKSQAKLEEQKTQWWKDSRDRAQNRATEYEKSLLTIFNTMADLLKNPNDVIALKDMVLALKKEDKK